MSRKFYVKYFLNNKAVVKKFRDEDLAIAYAIVCRVKADHNLVSVFNSHWEDISYKLNNFFKKGGK